MFEQNYAISQLLKVTIAYNLDICSPSCGNKGKQSWYKIMQKKHNHAPNELLITNFCEMGAMILSNRMVYKILEIYNRNILYSHILDYGFDHFICNIANEYNYICGIYKDISYINPSRMPRENHRKKYESVKNYHSVKG